MWRQLKRHIINLEVHEIISIAMLVILSMIYGVGLEDESLIDEIIHIAWTAGPITLSITFLMIVFFVAAICVKKGSFAIQARLLCRVMASFLVMLVSFEAVIHYISARGLPLQDSLLQDWDKVLFFSKQPAEWLELINNTPLTLTLSAAYLSWFAFTYGTIFLMWLYGRKALLEYTTAALTTFYVGYLIYIVVPAIGPIFTFTYSSKLGGLTAMMLDRKVFVPAADAFPSLHTGISIIMLIVVKKYARRWVWLYVPVMISIIAATIYLRIHYGVDVIAGVILSLFIAWICPKLLAIWERERGGLSRPS
ncbi:phosphatase PAP2 family protein [Paenibacillus sp. GCM10027628]|uniref:phosphatase PAP2 family protein n=1 Tax=Paenibacillus sp. GCM10027628 TaxID=3273413 RepID=UPI00362E49EB